MTDRRPPTAMFSEAAEAATVVARQYQANAALISHAAARLRAIAPPLVFTCARGSSDHAATYAKYLIETRLGIPTLSQAPSLASVHGQPLQAMAGAPFIVISQSGRSPDLLLSAEAAQNAGALVIAIVNDQTSPLAALADIVIPLHAGPERSVAATKSYIASLSAIAHLVSLWDRADDIASALPDLPRCLELSWSLDWTAGAAALRDVRSLFVLGRGLTLGVAQEAALKCKETSGLHAEAFSIAEVAHGPMALVGPGFPVLIFPPLGQATVGLDTIMAKCAARGAQMIVAGDSGCGDSAAGGGAVIRLPTLAPCHPALHPITLVQSFYRMINQLALARGFDPDHPPLLQKVTETL